MLGLATKAWGLVKGAGRWALGAGVLAGGAVAVDGVTASASGERTILGRMFGFAGEEAALVGARAAAEGQWTGFYAWMQRLGDFLMSISDGQYGLGLKNWALRGQGLGEVDAAGNAVTENTTATIPTEGMGEALTNAQQGDITASVGNTVGAFGLGVTGGFGQIVGHVADLGDWASGNVLSWVGIDTGYEGRDLSTDFMNGARNLYAENIYAPDLRGGWASAFDNIGHGTAYVATALTGAWATGTLGTLFGAASSPAGQAAAMVIPGGAPRTTVTPQMIAQLG